MAHTKRTFFVLMLAAPLMAALSSCSPEINVKATASGGTQVSFRTGFSDATTKALRTISGLGEDDQLFSAEYMEEILRQAGGEDVSARIPSKNEIETAALIKSLKNSALGYTGALTETAHSLTLTVGPKQFVSFYNILSEDSKSYFDMMMVPALIDEQMTVAEYRDLLASMYGPSFANEIVTGKITIALASPDGKKTTKATATLGEILTLTEERSWSVRW